MKFFLILILFCFLLAPIAFAKDLYVARNGNDSVTYANNDISHPWLSIDHGVDTMQAGDILYIRGGTYTETVTISSGGSGGSYKTIQNYTGETVILDGNGKTLLRGFDFANNVNYVKVIGIEVRDFKNFGITNWYGNINI